MKSLLPTLAISLLLFACVSKQDYDKLKEENAALKSELEDIKFGPDRTFDRAKSLLENKAYDKARSELDGFFNKHPELRSQTRFLTLSEAIDSSIAAAQKERELEEQRMALEKQRETEELDRFISKRYDAFQKITWYETKRNTQYEDAPYCTFQVELYFGHQADNTKFFRLRTRYHDRRSDYHDTQWIFYESIHLLADNGSEILVKTDYPAKQSDNDTYGLTEWSDNLLSESDVLAFANVNKIDVRFDGKYRHEFTMTSNQLKAFKEVIRKFKSM